MFMVRFKINEFLKVGENGENESESSLGFALSTACEYLWRAVDHQINLSA